MTKVIVTLRSENSASRVLSPSFRESLQASGVSAVQVNIDDDAVAPALRFGPSEPITALVSIWSDGDVAAVLDMIDQTLDEPEVHAYRVTEHVRLDPEPVPDGARSDVMAQMAVLRKPESMRDDEYLSYWMVRHTPVAIRTQNTSAYVQNVVQEVLTPTSPVVSGIVEEHFPMAAMSDPHEFYGSGGDDRELQRRMAELLESVVKFGADQGLDLVPTSRYFWSL